MNPSATEALAICDELEAIGEELENEADERGTTIKAKIVRMRQLIAAMTE